MTNPDAVVGLRDYVVATRARWVKNLVIVILSCGAIGAIAGAFAWPERYTAEARLAVGPESFAEQSVPGYVEAAKALASNYARYISSSAEAAPRWAERAGVDVDKIATVTASPIPESNIVRIEVTGPDEDAAIAVAGEAANWLKKQVNQPPSEAEETLERLRSVSEELSAAQGELADVQSELSDLRSSGAAIDPELTQRAVQVKTNVGLLQVQRDSLASLYSNQYQVGSSMVSLEIVWEPTLSGSNRASAVQWGIALGCLVGFLLVAGWVGRAYLHSREEDDT